MTAPFNQYPLVQPDQAEKSPGSAADFVSSPAMQDHFAELSAKFIATHPYVQPTRELGAPATASVVEQTNSQAPTPEV